MAHSNPEELTAFVIEQMQKIKEPREREIFTSLVKHLHAFVSEVHLSEAEFHKACGLFARLGQQCTPSHNEVVLMAGSLGVSSLVCLTNNGDHGKRPTTANLMGPFWRQNSPIMKSGESIVRSATPGEPVWVRACVKDLNAKLVPHARVDVWHSSTEGLYENQDPKQAQMNLRGTFLTDEEGRFEFETIKPSGYPIPINGLVGDLLKILGRHNNRPAHIHFMIYKEGYKTQFSQVYSSDDPVLDTDVQFGVTKALVGNYVRNEQLILPGHPEGVSGWNLDFEFQIEEGQAYLPNPPVTEKKESA